MLWNESRLFSLYCSLSHSLCERGFASQNLWPLVKDSAFVVHFRLLSLIRRLPIGLLNRVTTIKTNNTTNWKMMCKREHDTTDGISKILQGPAYFRSPSYFQFCIYKLSIKWCAFHCPCWALWWIHYNSRRRARLYTKRKQKCSHFIWKFRRGNVLLREELQIGWI